MLIPFLAAAAVAIVFARTCAQLCAKSLQISILTLALKAISLALLAATSSVVKQERPYCRGLL